MAMPGLGAIGGALRRHWKLLTIVGALFAAYTAGGFLLVPYLARSYVQKFVEQDLGRHVSIGRISFNPFTLTAEVANFALTEADGAPIASFDLFRVNAELRSLVYRAWTFKEIRIDKPSVSVLLNADGTLNLAKLKPPAIEPAPEPAAPAAIPALRIATFAVHEGRIAVEDRSRGQTFATTLTPIEFTLNDFRTAPDFQNAYNFEGSTLAGERLTWTGQFTVQPLGSTGRFTVASLKAATIASYLQDALPFALTSGTLDLGGEYRLAIAEPLGLTVDLPSVALRDFAIAPKGGDPAAPWVSVPELDVMGVSFSLADRKLGVERVAVGNAKLTVWREADGSLNVTRLMPQPASASAAPADSAPAASAAQAPAFNVSVGTIALTGAAVDIEDRTTRPAAKVNLAPIALTISGYSTEPNNMLAIDASVGVDSKGTVTAKGDLTASPLAANFDIDAGNIELPPIQPYLAQVTGLVLTSGQVSAKTKIAYAAEPAKGQPGLKVTGEVTVANLATQDTALHQDFIKWRQLRLAGIDYQQGPDRLSIDRIDAREPYGRVVISADQMLNVVAVLNPPGKAPAAAPAETAAPAAAPAPKAAAAAPPMPMRIGTIAVENGNANFADFSIEPNFAAAIQNLSGTVTGLSSAPNSRATVKLNGNVDSFAPVDISGTVNILSAAVFTDIAMNFRNMELTTFNPYSGKYAGYNISKGKLTTELHYKVENRKLDAQHHIVLDQLEFGAVTNSKDAVPLPIRLAVALLKDRNGVIDLNLPVGGSLDDPSFRIGPVIWQVFVGLVTKIVTAPFALIGSLFGGGEDLAYVDFAAGSSALTLEQSDKLSKVAMALAERPELKLDVPLQTLSPADDAALQEKAFDAAVMAAMPPMMGEAPAGPEQRLAALAKLYQEQMGMPPAYPVTENPAEIVNANIAFLEEALRPKYAPTQAARDTLARARADAVQAAVLSNKDIMPERVFLVERGSDKAAQAGGARMELALQ